MSKENLVLEFKIQHLKLGLKKPEIAKGLGISLPTLNSRIKDPQRFTINNLLKLKNLGFNYDYYGKLLSGLEINSSKKTL